MRRNLPNPSYFIDRLVPGRTDDLRVVELVASGNNGHLFRASSEVLARDFACKVIPRANLRFGDGGARAWQAEVQKADRVQNDVVVRFIDLKEWNDAASEIECVVLISDFVEGISLRQFLRKNVADVTVELVEEWLLTMLDLCYSMQIAGIEHGDLHLGNVLVEDRSARLRGPAFQFRVTDFGVAEVTDGADMKDDYHQLALMLAELLSVIDDQACSPRDKFAYDVLRNEFVARHLTETDPTRDPIARRPRDLFLRLSGLDAEFQLLTARDGDGLQSPFDYLSCEQIGEAAALLDSLYSDRFLGLEAIERRHNVVVTGPRGCGKTTVFRSLSLDQRLKVEKAIPSSLAYIGTYFRCIDLYFSFPRYRRPREEAIDIPLHFLTASLLGSLLESFTNWAKAYFKGEFARAEPSAATGLWSLLEASPPRIPAVDTLKAVTDYLNKQRTKATERQRFAHDEGRKIGRCFGPDILPRACAHLASAFSFVENRPFYFFIDDYSTPKISRDLQSSLNRLLMQRTSVCFFKISTESPASYEPRDLDGKDYVEGREFDLLNLGLKYIQSDLNQQLGFVEDVFRRRLENSNASLGSTEIEDLLGKNSFSNNAMAREIVAGHKPQFWGKETLCNLCSGDVHILIDLVADMVTTAGGTSAIVAASGTPKIDAHHQNKAIREKGGSFLRNLNGVPRWGERLVAVVEAFGTVAHSHLRYLKSKNDDARPPKQASRIEPYEMLRLTDEAREVFEELLRYSVFIEDSRGKSRRGSVVPRLLLRRLLLPHFQLTFSRRDSIELEPEDFEFFLTDPTKFAQNFRLRSDEDAARYERTSLSSLSQIPMDFDQSQS